MWESPITKFTQDFASDLMKKQDEIIIRITKRVGFDVDIDELRKALNYDRGQYEKGYADGRADRDADIVRCKDCKFFETDHLETINGIPLIVAHEICTRWGLGCKTAADGFCSLAERREE